MESSTQANEQEEWEKAEGVPQLSDPFIQQYFTSRDRLVAQEKKQRSDHIFRSNLSPTAAEACAIVDQIRFEERQTLWTKEYEDSLTLICGDHEHVDVFPGMMFSLARGRMERSKLWKIVKRMPKGALLHCHLEAMVDFDWAIEEAFAEDGVCITSSGPLDSDQALLKTKFTFTFSKTKAREDMSIWTKEYEPGTPIPINSAANSFPETGRKGFIEWVHSRCSITMDEHLAHHEGPNEIWRKFLSCFPILGSLIYYEPIFRKFIRRMCQQLLADGVYYVDMRSSFLSPYRCLGNEEFDSDVFNMLDHLQNEIESFKGSEEGKGFWGGRMIWTTVRVFDTRAVIKGMKQCIEMKLEFPDLICGYDLVGQEDAGRPLQDLARELFWFKKTCAESGVDIPFFFHAGETLGDGDSTDENLFDAVALGTRRIGHGFSLFKHPLLIDMVKEKKILIESCPISNEVLRLTGSIMSHTLPALLARGVPCSLSNDDPTILGQRVVGMTHDFWQTLQGWDNLGLAGLGSLAENSVRWASFADYSTKEWTQDVKDGAMGKGIRAQRLKEWIAKWESFCAWVVDEYGADANMNSDDNQEETI